MTLCLANSFAFVATWAHVDILASQNYWRLSERNPKTKLLTNPVFPSNHHQHLHQYHNKPCVNVLRVHPEWMLRLLHGVLQLGAGLQQQVGLVSRDGNIMTMHHESCLSGSQWRQDREHTWFLEMARSWQCTIKIGDKWWCWWTR